MGFKYCAIFLLLISSTLANASIKETHLVSVSDALALLDKESNIVLIDIRKQEKYQETRKSLLFLQFYEKEFRH